MRLQLHTNILIVLFPLLDKAPHDGGVGFKELEAWIAQQAIQGLNYRTEKELALLDKDEDGAISFREYLSQFSNEDLGTSMVFMYTIDQCMLHLVA